jgi:aryl-alcohol dehydrogenase-like predicted oxidoreductase
MMPLCLEEKIAVTPYSPLASGRLAREGSESTERYETDPIAKMKYDATADPDKLVIERVAEVAEKLSVPCAHIALAWLLQNEPVAAPVMAQRKYLTLKAR